MKELSKNFNKKEIRYCVNCLLPNTKPDLHIDQNGICAACNAYKERENIDWVSRRKDFETIVEKYRSTDGSTWDCIVPVSGGKDSTAQVIKVLELGLNPLCVTSTTCDLSSLGRSNIESIKNLGVDYVEFSPNAKIRRKLNKFALETVGDIAWPEHVGIFTIPVRAAVQFNVPLLIWGENSQNEYGGPASAQSSPILNRRWLEEFGGLIGMRVSDLPSLMDVQAKDLIPYTYPTDEELTRVGVTGLFLGHYFPWDGVANFLISQAKGFSTYGSAVEGSVVDYENLDNYQHGIHDYFKFLKFGYGRATDILSLHIRRGRMSREQALEIARERDGVYPHTYLGKPLKDILSRIDLTVDEFDAICEKFTNRSLFKVDASGQLMRDSRKNMIKIAYDN